MVFDNKDERVRSGLTANISIRTNEKDNVLSVPTSAIITRGNDKFVLVKSPSTGKFAEQKVSVGINGINGYTEIVSGLNIDDEVASFGNNN